MHMNWHATVFFVQTDAHSLRTTANRVCIYSVINLGSATHEVPFRNSLNLLPSAIRYLSEA